MFENEYYITVTGLNHYFSMKPFKVGSYVVLKKDQDNEYDDKAIEVRMPLLGRVGYVANSPYTLAEGCLNAGQLYNAFGDECAAVIRFITHSKVIAQVLPSQKLQVQVAFSLVDAQPHTLVQAEGAGEQMPL